MKKINMRNFRRDLLLFLCVLSVCIFNIGFVFITWFVKMVPSDISIKIGDSSKVVVEKNKYFPLSYSPIFTSDNESVATVDSDGTIHGVGEGIATIKAKVGLFEINSKTIVMVDNTLELLMNPSMIIIGVNGTSKVEAIQIGEPHIDGEVVYTSSDPSIVTVDEEGNIRGIKEGEVVITGMIGDVDAGSTNVYVVNSNSIGKATSTKISLNVDEVAKINVIGSNYTFTSSNSNIVSVDSEGNVKGISEGSATITVSNESMVISLTNVNVEKKDSNEIVIDEENVVINQKKNEKIELNLLIAIGLIGISFILIIGILFMLFKKQI